VTQAGGLFGGNSNWRGPIWMPVNALLVQSLRKLYSYYGDEFTVGPTAEPVGCRRRDRAAHVRHMPARRERPAAGIRRYGEIPAGSPLARPHWRDLVLFYEYFHGDNGAGLGASHQTGWTGLIAWALMSREVLDKKEELEKGFDTVAMRAFRSP
jgi:hypothetical protein